MPKLPKFLTTNKILEIFRDLNNFLEHKDKDTNYTIDAFVDEYGVSYDADDLRAVLKELTQFMSSEKPDKSSFKLLQHLPGYQNEELRSLLSIFKSKEAMLNTEVLRMTPAPETKVAESNLSPTASHQNKVTLSQFLQEKRKDHPALEHMSKQTIKMKLEAIETIAREGYVGGKPDFEKINHTLKSFTSVKDCMDFMKLIGPLSQEYESRYNTSMFTDIFPNVGGLKAILEHAQSNLNESYKYLIENQSYLDQFVKKVKEEHEIISAHVTEGQLDTILNIKEAIKFAQKAFEDVEKALSDALETDEIKSGHTKAFKKQMVCAIVSGVFSLALGAAVGNIASEGIGLLMSGIERMFHASENNVGNLFAEGIASTGRFAVGSEQYQLKSSFMLQIMLTEKIADSVASKVIGEVESRMTSDSNEEVALDRVVGYLEQIKQFKDQLYNEAALTKFLTQIREELSKKYLADGIIVGQEQFEKDIREKFLGKINAAFNNFEKQILPAIQQKILDHHGRIKGIQVIADASSIFHHLANPEDILKKHSEKFKSKDTDDHMLACMLIFKNILKAEEANFGASTLTTIQQTEWYKSNKSGSLMDTLGFKSTEKEQLTRRKISTASGVVFFELLKHHGMIPSIMTTENKVNFIIDFLNAGRQIALEHHHQLIRDDKRNIFFSVATSFPEVIEMLKNKEVRALLIERFQSDDFFKKLGCKDHQAFINTLGLSNPYVHDFIKLGDNNDDPDDLTRYLEHLSVRKIIRERIEEKDPLDEKSVYNRADVLFPELKNVSTTHDQLRQIFLIKTLLDEDFRNAEAQHVHLNKETFIVVNHKVKAIEASDDDAKKIPELKAFLERIGFSKEIIDHPSLESFINMMLKKALETSQPRMHAEEHPLSPSDRIATHVAVTSAAGNTTGGIHSLLVAASLTDVAAGKVRANTQNKQKIEVALGAGVNVVTGTQTPDVAAAFMTLGTVQAVKRATEGKGKPATPVASAGSDESTDVEGPIFHDEDDTTPKP